LYFNAKGIVTTHIVQKIHWTTEKSLSKLKIGDSNEKINLDSPLTTKQKRLVDSNANFVLQHIDDYRYLSPVLFQTHFHFTNTT
jgi:hypothetical protein